MKTVSVVLPTYNEEENVEPLCKEIIRVFSEELQNYRYEIIFIDNCSKDKTRELILLLCTENSNVKAIFNAKNFGQHNSPFYGLIQTTGDCAILMCADFQDPVKMLPQFVAEWEAGHKIVCAIKTESKENPLVYLIRTIYYKLIKKMSDIEQIEHFTGFGLYDRSFLDTMRKLDDPIPFLRGVVAELGPERKEIPYTQEKRKAGKSKNNWYSLYDAAMLSFTSYTKIGLRVATIMGLVLSVVSLLSVLVYLTLNIIFLREFPAGMLPVLLGVFVLGSLQLFFIGLIGEYIININLRLMNRPLVVEEKRINF